MQSSEIVQAEGAGESEAALPPPAAKRRGPAARRRSRYDSESDSDDEEDWDVEEDDAVRCFLCPLLTCDKHTRFSLPGPL